MLRQLYKVFVVETGLEIRPRIIIQLRNDDRNYKGQEPEQDHDLEQDGNQQEDPVFIIVLLCIVLQEPISSETNYADDKVVVARTHKGDSHAKEDQED